MKLRAEQIELLSEWINIGMGQAAAILHDMLQSPIQLQVPKVTVASPEEALTYLEEMGANDLSAVCMQFNGSCEGCVALMFPSESAAALVSLLCQDGDPSTDMDAMRSAALTEVGNVILNSVMGSIVNIMKTQVNFSLPFFAEESPDRILSILAKTDAESHIIMARTNFSVERNAVEGCIIAVFEISFLSKLGEVLEHYLQSM